MRAGIAFVALMLVVIACSKPTTDSSADLTGQYLTIARIAADRTQLDISDAEWLEFADLVCSRQLLNEQDYEDLIAEIQNGAPTPALGRAARDAGQSAISLFCPPEFRRD